jgi:hypothetical protein
MSSSNGKTNLELAEFNSRRNIFDADSEIRPQLKRSQSAQEVRKNETILLGPQRASSVDILDERTTKGSQLKSISRSSSQSSLSSSSSGGKRKSRKRKGISRRKSIRRK